MKISPKPLHAICFPITILSFYIEQIITYLIKLYDRASDHRTRRDALLYDTCSHVDL